MIPGLVRRSRSAMAFALAPRAWQAEPLAVAIETELSTTDLDGAFAILEALWRGPGESGGSSPRLAS